MANFSPPHLTSARRLLLLVCAAIGNALAYEFNGLERFLFQQVGWVAVRCGFESAQAVGDLFVGSGVKGAYMALASDESPIGPEQIRKVLADVTALITPGFVYEASQAGEIASSILITPRPWRRCHLIDWEVQRQQWRCRAQVSHCVRSG